ncbi:unnamed protein product [Dovyalis caffra]|uniref:Uncharacterized protein n=1 Tax=Dovyalis caffra TaxID=77055 RepID=A0AAV1SR35_9ROSI|nr:unnamed protein product [Dovyalis caffra]
MAESNSVEIFDSNQNMATPYARDSPTKIEEFSTASGSEDVKDTATPDVHNTAMKIERAREVYGAYTGTVGKPTKGETWLWYLYELCSYFIHTTLVPILFPLIISQIFHSPPEPAGDLIMNKKGLLCGANQMKLYDAVTNKSINISNSKFSPLEWTSLSWGMGLILAAPVLGSICKHLDYGQTPQRIAAAAIAVGAFFCLPTGFFNVYWILPPYIAIIIAGSTVAMASHTRQLGHMVRGFTGPTIQSKQFQLRRGVSSWLSLYSTAAGCLGAALMSAFTYQMLKREERRFVALWVVSIFSGLIWLVGMSHIITIKPTGSTTPTSSISSVAHLFSIFKFPHALGTVLVAFLSSFTTMCIFTSTVLYLLGDLCLKPVFILYFWLLYFIFPLISLPLMQPIQHVTKVNAMKMHLLGFILSLLTSGIMGFRHKKSTWQREHVLGLAALQSTSAGLLYAFGRVLIIDSSPHGKEGAFSSWFCWGRALGSCIGFAVASTIPGNIRTSFGVAFYTAISGFLLLIYGNISDFGGAKAAGHMGEEHGEEGSPVAGFDTAGNVVTKDVEEGGTP